MRREDIIQKIMPYIKNTHGEKDFQDLKTFKKEELLTILKELTS